MFDESNILFKEVPGFNSFAVDYGDKKEKLLKYARYFPSLSSVVSQIDQRKLAPVNRQVLAGSLRTQYNGLNIHDEVENSLQSIEKDNTFTITTGHQLNIFLGPLYVVYKICAAISLARRLSNENSAYNFVPVFWMASEDHDFEEISAVNLFGKQFKWENNNYVGAVGRISTKELFAIKEELVHVLGEGTNADQLKRYINEAYDGVNNLAQATRSLVNNIFGEYGLLIIDGDDVELKREWNKIAQRELQEKVVSNSTAHILPELKQDYFQQAAIREINLFHLENDERKRIVGIEEFENARQPSSIKLFSDKNAEDYMVHPEKLSPNVLMRPVYQECILPNLAYIGGSGEYAYWMQLGPVFDSFKIPFPLVVIRNSLMEIDRKLSQKMTKLNLTALDFCLPKDQLIKRFISSSPNKVELDDELKKIQSLHTELRAKAENLDPTLVPYIEGELKKIGKIIDGIGGKFDKVTKRKETQQIEMIERIKNKLTPGEVLKERVENFIPQYLKYGQSWIDAIIAKVDVIDKQFIILKEKDN